MATLTMNRGPERSPVRGDSTVAWGVSPRATRARTRRSAPEGRQILPPLRDWRHYSGSRFLGLTSQATLLPPLRGWEMIVTSLSPAQFRPQCLIVLQQELPVHRVELLRNLHQRDAIITSLAEAAEQLAVGVTAVKFVDV